MFSFVFWQIVKYFLYMMLGYGLGKAGQLPRETSAVLSRLLLYLMLPSAIFQSFCQNFTVPYLTEGLSLIALGLLTTGVQVAAATLVGRHLPRDTYTQNVCITILAVPNTSYVGIPLVLELFGAKTLMQMMLLTIPLTVYSNTEGYRLLVGKEKMDAQALLNPVTLSMLAGMAFGLLSIPMPGIVTEVLTGCGNCVSPLAMILMGSILSAFPIGEIFRDKLAYFIVFLRMIAMPAVLLLGAAAFGLSGEALLILTVANTMPTSMNAVIFPASVGKDCHLGAGLAALSNLVALVTIPLFFYLFCGQ